MDDRTFSVAEKLDLDMPWALKEALDIDRTVGERGLCLSLCQREQRSQLGIVARELHAAPATARHRFEQDRVADRARRGDRFVGGAQRAVGAWQSGDAKLLCCRL